MEFINHLLKKLIARDFKCIIFFTYASQLVAQLGHRASDNQFSVSFFPLFTSPITYITVH